MKTNKSLNNEITAKDAGTLTAENQWKTGELYSIYNKISEAANVGLDNIWYSDTSMDYTEAAEFLCILKNLGYEVKLGTTSCHSVFIHGGKIPELTISWKP